jgi:hypothetical protein
MKHILVAFANVLRNQRKASSLRYVGKRDLPEKTSSENEHCTTRLTEPVGAIHLGRTQQALQVSLDDFDLPGQVRAIRDARLAMIAYDVARRASLSVPLPRVTGSRRPPYAISCRAKAPWSVGVARNVKSRRWESGKRTGFPGGLIA